MANIAPWPPCKTAMAIRPNARQMIALQSRADVLFYGGAAGGGKSFYLLMEAGRSIGNGKYQGVIFRRTHPRIMQEGGLWEKSMEMYPACGGFPLQGIKQWRFPGGSTVRFCHLEHEKTKVEWNSSQIPFIAFDEATEFSETQFWYMTTRNRSTCGVDPYFRLACNPDADSWIAKHIAWWIDQDTGFPIEDRVGKLRWFVRIDEKIQWANTARELHRRWPDLVQPNNAPLDDPRMKPQSMTFVSSKLEDNKELMARDPNYRYKLMAMPLVERSRLLDGNWKIRPSAGLKFPRTKWILLPSDPLNYVSLCRYWDKAYTEGGAGAKTAGVLVGEVDDWQRRHLPQFVIIDCKSDRWGDAEREDMMRMTAELDTKKYGYVEIGIEDEGGAGKQASRVSVINLAGFPVFREHPTAKKHLRWTPLAIQQQVGNVGIVQGDWEWDAFIEELDLLAGDETLDKGKLKDKADAASGAFKRLTSGSFRRTSDMLASGPADRGRLTDKEVDELPPMLADILREQRKLDAEARVSRDDW